MSEAVILDGNEAAASVAWRVSEVIAIYPITPASAMGELSDEWSSAGQKNIFGLVPEVVEMQSEAGAAGAVHGALQAGALTTTFTASQGLLLMIPELYKIAGELTACCLHVAARTLATHALSIFGDHSDVMACRATGVALLCSSSVQEAQDMACVGHLATLAGRVPFIHFFDGFRTSHELAKVTPLGDDDLRALFDPALIADHRARALSPDHPVVRGTAQNPDVFFQAREACTPFYDALPGVVQHAMDQLAARTGRAYTLFEYHGHPEAERVIVLMGSGSETVRETVDSLLEKGERVGVVKVRLYRPFDADAFLRVLPASARKIAVLDRTKEPGATGDPLYLDVVSVIAEAFASGTRSAMPLIVGGRYGLSSKEFTPAMARAVYDELTRERPKRRFTVGIDDDVSHSSLAFDPEFDLEPADVSRAVFFGLGSDGTVGANKNSIRILGERTGLYTQGYFVYDSKKSGAVTVSHLRFGPRPIRSEYLVRHADFVACHQFHLLERFEVVERAKDGGTLLLNAPFKSEALWANLPREVQAGILAKRLDVWTIDADAVAREAGLGRRINTIMQVCFFALAKVMPMDEALVGIREAIRDSYARAGEAVIEKNLRAVDSALAHLVRVDVPGEVTATAGRPPVVSPKAPDFVQKVSAVMMAGHGDLLPVSAFPVDGTWPTGTARWEKRNLAQDIPVWDPSICIQCNKCVLVCPHSAIRAKLAAPESLAGAPPTLKHTRFRTNEPDAKEYLLQVAPEDCTGCTLCRVVCPAKDKKDPKHKALDMVPQRPLRESERANYEFFLDLPSADRRVVHLDVKGTQWIDPTFEYSGACSGCGETPYLKLMSQLFGDRALVANATGCSSIFGGNLPTTPWCTNKEGRGPAWANSLFEDNAEFGVGLRLAIDQRAVMARDLVRALAGSLGDTLVAGILEAVQHDAAGVEAQRERVVVLRERLRTIDSPDARRLETLADDLVRRSVWIVGGDGWAYDIGYGGLDHVLSMGRDVNILVLDTEVYSNTGGQQSKATPLAASARFAAAGKATAKKDLGLLAMAEGHVYVARVALGAKDLQTVRAFEEAESFPGTSLIIAYSPCIAHGYDLAEGLDQQKLAVDSGVWPLYRFDPRRREAGENPFHLDSGAPKVDLMEYLGHEARFRVTEARDPERFKRLVAAERDEILRRYALYEELARGEAHAATAIAAAHTRR